MNLNFMVNGEAHNLEVPADLRLVDILREHLGLTGCKEGCGEGECGACTVLVDNNATLACLTVAAQLPGREVVTIEGLCAPGKLSALQTAFIEETAIQCGYCTPGMIMSAYALLLANPAPTQDEIRVALAGNICRCSGYHQIIRAVQRAAREMGGEQ